MIKERTIQTLSIDGNCLCFNFVNTVYSRKEGDEPFDYLTSYEKLLEWCQRLEVLPPEQIEKLSDYATSHQKEANTALIEIIELRELLYLFFSDIASGQKVKPSVLTDFNRYLSQFLPKLRFVSGPEGLDLGWESDEPDLKAPLWRVMKSAYDILTQESADRIKECEACGWLFLDLSKNNSRRWCNMQTCGSIYKAKKYYYKKKNENTAS